MAHYPSSSFNAQYLNGGTIRLTSWRQAIVPQNTPPYGLLYYYNTGVSSGVVKNVGGAIYSFLVTNSNGSVRFFQIFNTSTTPTVTSAPTFSYILTPGSSSVPTQLILGQDFFGQNGIAFTTGISFGFSTSASTFLPTSTPTDHAVQVNYV